MFMRDKDKPMVAKLMMMLSFVSVVLAGLGAMGTDLFLASTQWLLVGILLGVWGVYLLLEIEFRSRA